MSKAKIPASLGGIEFDCLISREQSYSADAPEYPVEDGFYVSDSILLKPLTIEVTAFITNTPVTWAARHSGSNRVKTVSDALIELYKSKSLVSFVTPDKVYSNMAITQLSLPEDDYLNAIEVSISLKQISVTTAQTAVVSSYNYSGTSNDNAGSTATTEESSSSRKSSILHSVFGTFFAEAAE